MFQGYFKCRFCDTTLRQKRNSVIIPGFNKSFWIYYLLYILLVIGLGYGVLQLLILFEFQTIATISLILLYGIFVIGLGDELRARCWILVEADPEEDQKSSEKLTTTGVIVFLLHALISGGMAIWIIQNVNVAEIGNTIFLIGNLLYLTVVILIAVWILKNFSNQPDELVSM
jgi:hypothetical protein